MTKSPRIILNNLSFYLDHTPVRFNNINLSFERLKYGLLGNNGIGKTTFLKLLCGTLLPDKGSIQRTGLISFLPQCPINFPDSFTVQDVLCATKFFDELEQKNSSNPFGNSLNILQNQHDIQDHIELKFQEFKLKSTMLERPFSSLSGGQKTKVLLIKALLADADFILMDEPTNNLDESSREILYHHISSSTKGMIIVSHDRTLLNKMDCIFDITTKGIRIYGGNYDYYREQNEIERQALQRDYNEAKRSIKKANRSIQKSREKHEQRQSKGKKIRKSHSQATVILDNMKSRSEKTQSKMVTNRKRLINDRKSKLEHINEKIEPTEDYSMLLKATSIPSSKTVLEIKKLSFQYPNQSQLLIKNFNLKVTGPERIELEGPNGCGKSTLSKLIKGELIPLDGKINVGVDHIAYLDQDTCFLDHDLTLVDNFLKLNLDARVFDAYSALAAFKFRNKDAEKKVATLSGGERIRAALAILLMSNHPPQLMILDEPTNHLDLNAIEAIENMLKNYQGSLLLISHDKKFIDEIGINRTIEIS